MHRVALALLLAGCTEYDLYQEPDPPDEPIVDTGEPAPDEPIADAPIYANTSTDLFEVDPETGERTRIGSFRDAQGAVENMVDIAIDLDGRVYGGTYDALYRIDPNTAEVTPVCNFDVDMTALAFTSDGVLYAGGDKQIDRIDVDSCGVHPLVQDADYKSSGDIVGLPDGFLYWTVRGEDGDGLVRVSPNNGHQVWIGRIGVEGLFGVAYDDGDLYGFSRYGETIRISPEDASPTMLQYDEDISWWGATTNPVMWD